MAGILRHTDYAARVVLHIAGLGSEAKVPIAEISKQRLMPDPFVRRVVARLAWAGILRNVRGSGGGVALARPAADITLLDIVRAMEGGVALNRCVSDPGDCPLSDHCTVHRAWLGLTRGLEESLLRINFADLLEPVKRSPRRRKER
jgi:Rrf2 family protein